MHADRGQTHREADMLEREATFWVPLGYSSIWRADGVGSFKDQLDQLREVLGNFETISFHTFRLGEQIFKVSVNRRGLPSSQISSNQKKNISETVSGMLGDQLTLLNGETLIIEKFTQSSFQLHLKFWSNK